MTTGVTNFTAAAGSRQVVLEWDAVAGAYKYLIYMGRSPYSLTLHGRTPLTSYTVENLDSGTYLFQLDAVTRSRALVVYVGP